MEDYTAMRKNNPYLHKTTWTDLRFYCSGVTPLLRPSKQPELSAIRRVVTLGRRWWVVILRRVWGAKGGF